MRRGVCLALALVVSGCALTGGRDWKPTPPIVVPPVVDPHVDPSVFTLEQLARIRGSMWTARLDVPYGPRPDQPDNILAMVFYDLYDAPTRARMVEAYKARGYTHYVVGPVTGNDCYHYQYPCRQGLPNQAEWDAFLDSIQERWDAGLVPVYFAKPDGWEFGWAEEDMRRLDELHRQPRAQKLLRIVIYPGWEPSGWKYGWNNEVYVYWLQRGKEIFPNALLGLHTACDLDAPVGEGDNGTDNGERWSNVTPLIHFWAVQTCGYDNGGSPVPTDDFLREWDAYWRDLRRRFDDPSYRGWPNNSAFGPGIPIRRINSEYAAFPDYWKNWPESEARRLGDLSIAAGADGYLDGGTVDVP